MGLTATQRPGRPSATVGLPSIGPIRRDAFYQTGTADPRVGPDIGAGLWKSRPMTAPQSVAQKTAILSILGIPTSIYPGRNATAHMLHYLYNSGDRYEIDLENMIASVPSARMALVAEFRQAQRFIATMPPGTHQFTSRASESAYNFQGESADWFFAIAGYSYWGKGVARITAATIGLRYEVEFEYNFRDRYNWDGGKMVTIGSIEVTDEFKGEFIAKALRVSCFGRIDRHLVWEARPRCRANRRSSGGRVAEVARPAWIAVALALSAWGTGPATSRSEKVTMADPQAVASDMGVTIPAAATVEHGGRIAGRDNAARLVLLLPTRDWQAWQPTLLGGEHPSASPDANFHLGPYEGGWMPGKAAGLATVQLPWRGGTEALNVGHAPAGSGQVRVFLFWHQL